MKISEKALSVFLAVCLLAGVLPAEALAEWTEPDGIESVLPAEDTQSKEAPERQPEWTDADSGESALPEEDPQSEEAPERQPEWTDADSGESALPAEDTESGEPPEDQPDEETDSGTCGNHLTWTLDKEGTLTISGTGKMEDSPLWNDKKSSIKTVVIEEGVTSIGEAAFWACDYLTGITISESVTSIGYAAFSGCSGLTSLTIPESVTYIGGYAFLGCGGLTDLTIPESVTSISGYAFSGCSGLTTAGPIGGDYNCKFGWKTTIPGYAFIDCIDLTSVTFPESLDAIGTSAFYGCSGLTSVTIPEGMTSIENTAFQFCGKLTHVTFPESLTSIGYAAFQYSGLTKVSLPEHVTSMGASAFDCGSNLTSAGPAGGGYDYEFQWKTEIPANAFSGCGALTSVTLPESTTVIGENAFWNCKGLTSVTIPESVTSIGAGAFADCSGLTGVTVPEGVTSMGMGAFSGCGKLTSAGPAGGDYDYKFEWKTEIPANAFSRCDRLTSVTLPEGVTAIGDFAFSYCSSLASMTVPEGVTSIGDSAFSYCTSLTSVTLPEGVTSIGDSAFSNCGRLIRMTLPKGVTTIGDSAFYYCGRLASVTIPEGVTTIGDSAFYYCSELTSVTIPEGVTAIGASAFRYCRGLTSVTIPESATSIGRYAFSYCSKLTSAGPIGGNDNCQFGWKTEIPEDAFYDCSSLTSVTIPEGMLSIGNCAFSNCGLTRVTFPEGMTSIGESAFYYCSELTSVTFPESMISIGAHAFEYCGSLTGITIPKGVRSMGYGAFNSCKNLTSVTIEEGVPSIGEYAFKDCGRLTKITIPMSVTDIQWGAFSGCSSDLCVYCYPNSYAETYAANNKINCVFISNGDDEVSGWLAANVLSGVVASTEFLIRAGYLAQGQASLLRIDLPQSLVVSSVWLDGEKLASYDQADGFLTISLPEQSDSPAHTLHLYCTATSAGSHSVSGTVTFQNAETYSLGTAVVNAEPARLDVPGKVGQPSGILATGKAVPGSRVTLFVDDKTSGSVVVNDAGSWQIPFNLGDDVEDGSEHKIHAEIQLGDAAPAQTNEVTVLYHACDVKLARVTMYNTGDRGAQETVFDFTKPEEANLIRYYRIWPSSYPSFTFKAEFSSDPSKLSGVSIRTINSAGKETLIPAIYDPDSNSWAGTHDYTSFQDAPVWVSVVYGAEKISSGRFSTVPIMDPSGYVYEAVPSNLLAGVKATISCKAEDGSAQMWEAENFDQINPWITGPDGSYYWDVPKGDWKVSFTKEGYEPAETDWLTVPPPRVDIMVPMISTAAPEVKCAAVYETYAEITFSQYMDTGSVKISLDGSDAAVEALDAEDSGNGTQYATRFRATADGLSGQVNLTVRDASNYAGTAMKQPYTQEFTVETQPAGISAPETVRVRMSACKNIRATLNPGIAGRTLTIENLTPAMIHISETSAITDDNGRVTIPVNALLPGTGTLRITEPVSGLETTVFVQIKTDSATEICEASIENGRLTYYIDVSGELTAQLMVASYHNQCMRTIQMTAVTVKDDSEFSGTLELTDPSAGSYVLFLVEPGTMKPLCPKFPVSVNAVPEA